ncbi:MAG TPA: ABC transporter substrate-binding protein [Candidatus Dojkabacteria bacterium]|nr:ABC transporter substrate-binding protein [Candidatus Dojkabacteria bacterium]
MSFRDILWNYPDILAKVTRGLAPISYILITLGILLFVGNQYFPSLDFSKVVGKGEVGVVNEGTVGFVSNLNPLYIPQSQVDRDIQALVFRKLVRIQSDGRPVGDLVKSWSVSSDLLTYEFTMVSDAKWHDGEAVTADDVVFTINTARELSQKLSQETVGQGFEGLRVEKIDRYKFKVVLDQYSSTFWETISLYIVPDHVFEGRSISQISESTFSKKPIGNGYYEIESSSDMLITLVQSSVYERNLSVRKINYHMYASAQELEVAFRNRKLDMVSGVPLRDLSYMSEYSKQFDILQTVIGTRKKVLFLNNRVSAFGTASVRRGLSYLIDRDRLIEMASVDGRPAFSSYSAKSWVYDSTIGYYKFDPKKAEAELSGAGYKKDKASGYYQSSDGKVLTVTITYLDNDANSAIVSSLKDLLKEQGVIVELDGQSFERLTRETLATRDYGILLYEVETSIDPDQYDLWHSLRKDYPYLNLSGYTYDRVDIFLERGRTQTKKADRQQSYSIVQRLINEDAPAIFLYEPEFNVVVSNRIENVEVDSINYPEERYNYIQNWEFK